MNNPKKISSTRPLFFLCLLVTTNKVITNLPSVAVKSSGTSAPLSILLSGLLFLAVLLLLLFKMPANIWRLKAPLKQVLGIVAAGYLIFDSVYILTETAVLIKLISFPVSPVWFIVFFIISGAVFGALGNKKSLLGISGIIGVFHLTTLLVLALPVLFQGKISNLFPVLGTGISDTVSGSFRSISLYADIFLLFFLCPEEMSQKTARATVIISAVTAVLFILLLTVAYTAKIPYPVSAQEQYPVYLLLKEVYFGRFFQRIDAVFLLSSALSQMLSIGVNIYLIVQVFSRFFAVNEKKAVLFPASLLIFFLSVFPMDTTVFTVSAIILAFLSIFAVFAFLPKKEVQIDNEK